MKRLIISTLTVLTTGFLLFVPSASITYAANVDQTDTIIQSSDNTDTIIQSSDSKETEDTISIEECKISLSKTVYNYTGKAKTPKVTVYNGTKKLKKNVDYEITYNNNLEIGNATVTVTGINKYSGTVTKKFTIYPKTPSAVTARVINHEIEITFNRPKKVDSFTLYRREKGTTAWTELQTFHKTAALIYDDEDCTYGVTYEYALRTSKKTDNGTLVSDYGKITSCKFEPAAPTLTQFMPVSANSVSLKWDLEPGADGYIIYQKIDGKWKKVKTVAAYATNHCTIDKLTYKDTYEFAIRGYWLSNGSKQKGTLSAPIKEKLSYKSKYEGNNKLYYDASGDLITDVEGIIGAQAKYEIEINRTTNTVIIYAADPKKKDCRIPVKAFLCSTGKATPLGTFKTSDKYRWHPLFHSVYGQWCTRITKNILFHSVYYAKNSDANTLDVEEFNKLGTPASAGCIRLCCEETKWIYDNCSKRTVVTLYDDPNPGPFGTPEALILEEGHTWDPTDPEMKKYCKKNGCHQE